jgi:hypothetical protein
MKHRAPDEAGSDPTLAFPTIGNIDATLSNHS